jgi:dCTP diphosphatase
MKKAIETIRQFNRERDWEKFHTPANLAKSIAIEAGELLELYQWSDEVKDLNHLQEELADVLSYLIMLADHYGFDLEEILLQKIKKNALKYPVNKARGKSDKYDELEG